MAAKRGYIVPANSPVCFNLAEDTLEKYSMPKKRETVNWLRVVLGAALVWCFYLIDTNDIHLSSIEPVTVTAKAPITPVTIWKGNYAYKIKSKEKECSFGIKKVKYDQQVVRALEDIRENDTITMQVPRNRMEDMRIDDMTIPVYSLRNNGKIVFELEDYNSARKHQSRSWSIFALVAGLLLMARGFYLINDRIMYWIGTITVIVVLILRFLHLWG